MGGWLILSCGSDGAGMALFSIIAGRIKTISSTSGHDSSD